VRTTNPIESSFARVKLRTRVTKGAGSEAAALPIAYKLLYSAQERWRRLNGERAGNEYSSERRSRTEEGSRTTMGERVAAYVPHSLTHNIDNCSS
jgi:hypothetical protein